jgi:flagellar assembly protein FliH
MTAKSAVVRGKAVARWQFTPLKYEPAAQGSVPEPLVAPMVNFDVDTFRREALQTIERERAGLLAQAQAEAQALVQAAESQRAAFVDAARREGLAAAEQETSHILLTAQGVLDEARAWHDQLQRQAESEVLALAVRVFKLLLGETFTLDPDLLKNNFQRALTEARTLGSLRAHMHPDDAELLGEHWPTQVAHQMGQPLTLIADATIRRGGCLIEGEHGTVDARLETQLDVAINALSNNT